MKCGSTRAAQGRAALRISKHLFGGGSGGLVKYGSGEGHGEGYNQHLSLNIGQSHSADS